MAGGKGAGSMKDETCFLYLIAAKVGDRFVAPVKVGVSHGPMGRLATLQTASPRELGIVGIIAYPCREIALKMEDCFHETQGEKRLRGEWFDIEPDKALALARLQLRFALSMFAADLDDDIRDMAIAKAEEFLAKVEAH
jgi:hypothetical protein